jgi:hypothetical protein
VASVGASHRSIGRRRSWNKQRASALSRVAFST